MTRRMAMQRLLGIIWLFDGLLQFRPLMLSRGFIAHDVLPLAQGEPPWLHAFMQWDAHLLLWNPVLSDLAVGVIQVAIGVLLLMRRSSRWGLVASSLWAVAVWAAGEAFGQIFTGMSWLGNGAPGAALLYALLSWGLWPSWTPARRVRFFQIAAASLWVFEAVMWLEPSAQVGMHGLGHGLGMVVCLGIAALTLSSRGAGLGGVLGATAALLSWTLGERFGLFWQPYATDLNSGLLLALLSIAVWVFRSVPHPDRGRRSAPDEPRPEAG